MVSIAAYAAIMIVTAARGQAEQQGHELKGSKFPFRAIGKALIEGDPDGFVKIVADAETDRILGMHAIGPHVTELIAEGVFAKLGGGHSAGARDERARPSLAGGDRRRGRDGGGRSGDPLLKRPNSCACARRPSGAGVATQLPE
jgi:hypothetical protein